MWCVVQTVSWLGMLVSKLTHLAHFFHKIQACNLYVIFCNIINLIQFFCVAARPELELLASTLLLLLLLNFIVSWELCRKPIVLELYLLFTSFSCGFFFIDQTHICLLSVVLLLTFYCLNKYEKNYIKVKNCWRFVMFVDYFCKVWIASNINMVVEFREGLVMYVLIWDNLHSLIILFSQLNMQQRFCLKIIKGNTLSL